MGKSYQMLTLYAQDVSRRIDDRFLLNSYLIKPFQRITKYKIFIEEMIKYSTKADMKGKLKEYYDKLKVQSMYVCMCVLCMLHTDTYAM